MIDPELYEELRQESLEQGRSEAIHQYKMRSDPEYVNAQPEFQEFTKALQNFTKFCKQYELPSSDMIDLVKDTCD